MGSEDNCGEESVLQRREEVELLSRGPKCDPQRKGSGRRFGVVCCGWWTWEGLIPEPERTVQRGCVLKIAERRSCRRLEADWTFQVGEVGEDDDEPHSILARRTGGEGKE